MSHRHPGRAVGPRSLRLLGFVLCLALSAARGARADQGTAPNADQCISFHVQGQKLRASGRFTEARDLLRECLHPACSPILRADCASLLEAVEKETPTVVLAASAAKNDLVEVSVYEGERLIASRLDGRPIPLDPGLHTLRFETGDRAPLERTIVVHAGEKNRLVSVSFESAEQGAAPPESAPKAERDAAADSSASAKDPGYWAKADRLDYALLVTGGVLAAVGAGPGIKALTTLPAETQREERLLITADVLIGTGLVLTAAALIRIATHEPEQTNAALIIGPRFVGGRLRF